MKLAPPTRESKALVEAGLMIAAVLGVARYINPEDPWLIHANPHPFWGVIILIAVRYGMPVGPIVGAVCACLHLVGMEHSGHSIADAFQLGGATLLTPLLYLVVAVVIGETIEQMRQRSEHFRLDATKMRQKMAALEAKTTTLEQAYRQVEVRLAGRTDTVIALYDGARHLASLDRHEIMQGVLDLLTGHLGVERASIWIPADTGGFIKLLPVEGGHAPLPALGEAVLSEGVVLAAHEHWLDEDAPLDAGLVAGPLRADSPRIEAVIVVESLRFAGFTPAFIREFELLLDWASRALGNAARVNNPQTAAHYAAQHRQRNSNRLVQTLDDAQAFHRDDQPAMLLIVRLEGELSDSVRRRLELVIRRICRHLTRPTDSVSWKPLEHTTVMFLPGAYGQAGDNLRDRIERCLDAFGFRPYGDERGPVLRWAQVGVPGMADPHAMFREAITQISGE